MVEVTWFAASVSVIEESRPRSFVPYNPPRIPGSQSALMNTRDPQALIEKLKQLPPDRVAEVEDFVDFLRAREQGSGLERAAMRAAEPAFAKVWDNEDDAAYDKL